MEKFKYIIFLFLFGILTLFNNNSVVEAFTTEYEFNYIGDVQEFIVPVNGTYKLEVWGAQGAGNHQHSELGYGGKGGYSTGELELRKGTKLYIYVGGQGNVCYSPYCSVAGGYNGGGSAWKKTGGSGDPAASGGGATDIRLIGGLWNDKKSLLSRFIVAGAGGGGGMDGNTPNVGAERGGDGGGLSGIVYDNETGHGGTQDSGWKFGEGFSANSKNNAYISNTYGGAGGGSGWYGGSFARNGGWQGAGGGSGFVLTRDSATKVPNGYSVTSEYYLKNALTQAGNELIPTHNHETTMKGNSGNGFAKITILEYDALQIADLSLNYLNTGNYEVIIPNEEFETTISYNNPSVIWSSGTGKVTLKVDTIHEVILMDDNGSINVYNIKVLSSKVYLDNVIFDGIDFKFDKQRYLYEFNVSNEINEINPNIVVSDDVTYKINKTTLNVGKNIIEIIALKDGFTSSTYTFVINREYAKTLDPIINTFDYTGDYQEFIAPFTGNYKLEVWGAQGGGAHQKANAELGYGGKGGYSTGIVHLNEGEKLYIYVGGEGTYCATARCTAPGGYNGGGSGYKVSSGAIDLAASGGGATDIRLIKGVWDAEVSLKSRLIVAGGGGGGGMDGNREYDGIERGGDGGGFSGIVGSVETGNPGTQTSGWAFGKGFAATSSNLNYTSTAYGGPGAGGGWYGGYHARSGKGWEGAGGGSGFIWTNDSVTSVPTGYNVDSKYYLKDAKTIAGNTSMPDYTGTGTMTGNGGNGYAKITYYDPSLLDELLNIKTSIGVLNPEFSSLVKEYDLYLDIDETELTIEAELKKGEGLVTGTGTFIVDAGTSVYPITFTNANGDITIYNINVTRNASSSASIAGFKVNGILNPDFREDLYNYQVEIPTEVTKINLELLKKYPNQIIPTDTIYDFTEEELSKTLIVSSEKDLANATYNFIFKRKKSTILKSLEIKNGTLIGDFNPLKTEYTLELSNSTRELFIDAKAWFSDAKITITEPRYVGIDDKTLTIKVDLDGVESTTYTFNIERVEDITYDIDEGYEYTGDYQEFVAPFTGNYKLEVWGAQGGGAHQKANAELGYGGKGGYSTGTVFLNSGEKLYIYVGGEGTYCATARCVSPGGYNGGGSGYKVNSSNIDLAASGGGATDIRFIPGVWSDNSSLLSRLIVAGGGGGGGMDGNREYAGIERGGDGGGISGIVSNIETGNPGTQTSGWAFGKGFAATSSNLNYTSTGYGGPGAGGGWYGGYHARPGRGWEGAGGGSGFVFTKSTFKNTPSGYSVDTKYYLKDAETIAGNTEMPTHDGLDLMTGNSGNGYAKITATGGVNGDTFLDSITLNDGDIQIPFEPWTLEYNVFMDKDTPILKVNAISKDSNATIIGNGEFNIAPGESEHHIIVSTSDGSYKTYTINITKEPSDDATPKNIAIKNPQSYLCGSSKILCNYSFKESENNYEIVYPFETTDLTFNAELKSPYQSVTYYLVTDDGDVELNDGKLALDDNISNVKVKITSESGIENFYNYKITKDASGNNVLKTLEIISPPIDIEFDSYIYEYTFTVPSSTERLELKLEAVNTQATILVDGNENLKVGMNQIKIKVTAENGNSRTYILNVYKEKSDNTYLSSLIVTNDNNEELELTPTFNKLFTNYNATASSSDKTITINAIPEEGIVTGNGTFNLVSGKNVFPITVTSESGETMIYEVIIMKSRNNNSNLLNIEIEGYELSPEFDKATKNYTVSIPKSVNSLNVKVTPEEESTTYTIRGNTNLTDKSNTIVITSIAEDKTYQVYQIVVLKETSDNNYLKNIEVTNGVLNETFDRENLTYTIDVDSSINSININGIKDNESAIIKGNGTYALVAGENIINLFVTSESGNERVYTIKVNKKLNSDTSLEYVTNNRGSEVIKQEDTTLGYDYLINVQYEVNTIEITGKTNSRTSIITGNGNYNLKPGDNSITLRVTAEDGNSKDYIVKVVRDLSNNDDLSFLFTQEGGLSPIFSETTIYYDVLVPFNTNTLHITAIPEDINAFVDVSDSSNVDTFKYTKDISNLEANESTSIDIVVTAQNGDIKIYTIHVTKQSDTNEDLTLLSLETNRGELIPAFNPNTLNYTLEVENDITDITITAETFNPNVNIKGLGTYNLKVGKNSIPIFVVGESGVQKDYQIVVTRKKSNDASLSNLVVKSHVLNPYFNKDVLEYNLITSNNALEFTIIKPTESEATYEVLGNNDFKTGENIVTIRVTAPDGVTTKDYILKVEKTGSKNNNLANLEVVDYTLTPKFHKGVTLYTTEVSNDVISIVIEALPEDKNATINGTGLKTIVTGENYFEVVVTSEAGDKKVYIILVIKEASDNNYLSSLQISEGVLNPIFDKELNDYTVSIPYNISSIEISGKLEDSNATVSGFGTFNLSVGDNDFSIAVTSESGLIRTYNLKVIREDIVSAYLTDLDIKGYQLDTEFNKEILEYFITVPSDIDNIELTLVPEDAKADLEVIGDTNLEVGMNEVHIKVTASDKITTLEYIIYVNKEMSTNNYLSSLTSSLGDLMPEFDPTILEYIVEVPRETEKIIINATTQDKSANITSGLGEHSLVLGNNIVFIKVKSAIGITRTYKVNVIRKADDNNYLQNLKVMYLNEEILINPEFNKDINEYDVTVNSDFNFVQIKADAINENATITGTGIKELKTGLNKFEIVVTAENGSINTYILNITKEVSSNNYLVNLIPSSGSLNPKFNKDILEYTLDLGYETSELEFNAIVESNLAHVTGVESKVVSEGLSTREIIVTAEDGSVRTYKINVNKETAAEARLESLEIEGYMVEFNPDTYSYNLSVSISKKELLESEIKAIPKDENATVNLMGDLTIHEGMINIYVIEVIAKDGYTTETYTLNITRDSAEHSLRSNKYEIVRNEEEDYVIGIQPSTIISDFKNNFENSPEDLKVYLETDEVNDTELTATALVLKLEKNGYIYDTLRVIVRGDLTKDGKVNITDQVKMINFVGRTTTFDKYQMLAGDLTFDGKVNITDQVKIINYVGRTISDINTKPTN